MGQVDPIYSVRITKGYRAVAWVQGGAAIWYFIGSHAEYHKLLDKSFGPLHADRLAAAGGWMQLGPQVTRKRSVR